MTGSNGTAVVEAEVLSEVSPTPVPQEATIKISLPDIITVGMWQTYVDARDNADGDLVTRRYFGALALIKAQYVRIEGTDKLKELVTRTPKQHNDVPAAIMGLLVRTISHRIEASLDADFLDYLKDL